ncbi:hypothetical protein CA264_04585 [Pontibacter actiniarum]|uniref:Glycosyl transferase family 1 n=2 Tax=Pontibacter actiniarum TaxID=323450 RepID=A0A1X9YY26_9BACT|nr:hypothetical protein CA264_04585 [Pontibacter actiniarum]
MINASGIGVYLKNLLPIISKEFKLTLLGDEKDLKLYCNSPGTNVIIASAPIYSIKEQLQLARKIPKCDLFWSPHYNIPLLPIAARKRVTTIHDVYHLAYQHTLTLPQKAYANFFIRAAVKLSNKLITVSEFSKSEIVRYTQASSESIFTIHNGVDTEKFSEKRQISHKLLNKQASKYILYVGNVKPHKNLVTLLKAYSQIQQYDVSCKLLIVGKKEGFITSDNQIATLLKQNTILNEGVVFTGFVEEDLLPQLYQNAVALVVPSVYEGFGLPSLEAMASGCPVIASTAASIPEICGDAAMYFDPLDHESLADRLKCVLTSIAEREILVTKGYSRIKSYSWQKSAEKHTATFKQVLEANL